MLASAKDDFYDLFVDDVKHFLFPLQTGEKSGQVEKSKKNARQRQNDFKVSSFSLSTKIVIFRFVLISCF